MTSTVRDNSYNKVIHLKKLSDPRCMCDLLEAKNNYTFLMSIHALLEVKLNIKISCKFVPFF